MSISQFTIVSNTVFPESVMAIDNHLQTVACQVIDQYSFLYGRPIGDDEVLDYAGSFEGARQKRGRVTLHRVRIFIGLETGLFLDLEVLTSHCVECGNHPNSSNVRPTRHKPVGIRNFEGNSDAITVEAAQRFLKRFNLKFNFRYTIMLSNGNSKTLKDLHIYGSNHPISRKKCINHVAKRKHNGLITLKKTHKSTRKKAYMIKKK